MKQDLSTRYALLTRLPLFQGISSTDLLNLEEAMRLDLEEFHASKQPLIRQGDPCSKLVYLVEGELKRERRSADDRFSTRSSLRGPAVIEVDRLFGLTPTYEYSYHIQTDIKVLAIRKTLISSHLMKSEVFRLNLLNTLSAIAQKKSAALLPVQMNNAEERLRHFVGTLFQDSEGEVELFIQMTDIARYIGETRVTVSRVLNGLNQEGSIRLGREHFTIHDIKAFLNKRNSMPSLQHHEPAIEYS